MSKGDRKKEGVDESWWKPSRQRPTLSNFLKYTVVAVWGMTLFAYGLTSVEGDNITCVSRNVVVGVLMGVGIGVFLTFYRLTNLQGQILVLIPLPVLMLLMC